jgi:putative Holliday junction resolvase
MSDGYVLGIDFGLKHIGIAVGQTVTRTANGLITLTAKNGKPDWAELSQLIQQYRPIAVVVGLPLNMDDTPSEMSERATDFAQKLSLHTPHRIFLADERLSSWAVRTSEDGADDSIHNASASLIAETFLNDPSGCKLVNDDPKP